MIIAWWSAGVTSAVATKLAIDEYGKDNVLPIYFQIDSSHEDIKDLKSNVRNGMVKRYRLNEHLKSTKINLM